MDHNPETRHSFGIEDDAWNEFTEIVEDEGYKSNSHALRELVYQMIEEHSEYDRDHYQLPDDDRLREAYMDLLGISCEVVHGGWVRCTLEDAKNSLYTNQSPKSAVRKDLINPLQELNYVKIDSGINQVWIVVRPLESTISRDPPSSNAPDARAVATDGGVPNKD